MNTNDLNNETVKQLIRRVIRTDRAMEKAYQDNKIDISDDHEANAELAKEEIYIRMYNKGLIADWTDYEGLDADDIDKKEFADFFQGVDVGNLWIIGDGGWC